MLYGMHEAYITKVGWVSFCSEGPFFRAGGIALFEMILLVLFLHALLAFVVPVAFHPDAADQFRRGIPGAAPMDTNLDLGASDGLAGVV